MATACGSDFGAAEYVHLYKVFLTQVRKDVTIDSVRNHMKRKNINFMGIYLKSRTDYIQKSSHIRDYCSRQYLMNHCSLLPLDYGIIILHVHIEIKTLTSDGFSIISYNCKGFNASKVPCINMFLQHCHVSYIVSFDGYKTTNICGMNVSVFC